MRHKILKGELIVTWEYCLKNKSDPIRGECVAIDLPQAIKITHELQKGYGKNLLSVNFQMRIV